MSAEPKRTDEERLQGKNGEHLSILDRLRLQALGKGLKLGNPEDIAQMSYPHLWDLLTRTDASDEKIMEPGKLGIRASVEGWVITARHDTYAVVFEIVVPSLDQCFEAIDQAIAKGQGMKPVTRGQKQAKKRLK